MEPLSRYPHTNRRGCLRLAGLCGAAWMTPIAHLLARAAELYDEPGSALAEAAGRAGRRGGMGGDGCGAAGRVGGLCPLTSGRGRDRATTVPVQSFLTR